MLLGARKRLNKFTYFHAVCQPLSMTVISLPRILRYPIGKHIYVLILAATVVTAVQISRLSEGVAECPRLKVLRLEENCLEMSAFTPKILRDSNISLLAIDGNVFDNKSFQALDGYDQVSVL